MRLDQALAQKYHLTRNRAQQLIEAGLVFIDQKPIFKASYRVDDDQSIFLQEDKKIHWVSRSAEKLFTYLEYYPIPLNGKHALDVGSSTGGFTQVLLEGGISHVDAVDVGTDQLHSSLQEHPSISLHEQTDIRDFSNISQSIYDIIVCDASFISLCDILPAILQFSTFDTDIILLFKPQIEVGPSHLKKTGVPKSNLRVEEVMCEFESFLGSMKCHIIRKIPSSLKGESGNQEWIYHIKNINNI